MILILIIGVIALIVLGTLGWIIGQYNFFGQTKEAIDTQWSNILTEYERRIDLFLNLAQNVKGYKKHEKETLKEVIAMRNNKLGITKKEQQANMHTLDKMISGMNVVFEKYPELKANGLYDKFMEEIRITEDRINASRTGYNTVVREYESTRVSFPNNLVANHFNFKEIDYWKTDRIDVIKHAPKVDV